MVTNTQRYWLRKLWYVSGFLVSQKGMDFYLWIVLSLASAVWKRKKKSPLLILERCSRFLSPYSLPLTYPPPTQAATTPSWAKFHRSTCSLAKWCPPWASKAASAAPLAQRVHLQGPGTGSQINGCGVTTPPCGPRGPPALAHHSQVCFHD